jgi:hypothetical protein
VEAAAGGAGGGCGKLSARERLSLEASVRALVLLVLLGVVGTAAAQQRLIYDDDCSQDVDCVATLPIVHALEDRGEIKIRALVADSANPMTAPVMRLFANYAGHKEMVIGANQSDDPATALCSKNACNTGVWADKLVERFDAGDTRANYPDCVTVYRRALAEAPKQSVAIAVTGFATCLNQLLASRADGVSQLTGAELVKQKVKLLSVMGGRYPTGNEWNFQSDAPGFHRLFVEWTRQHGYPPVYLNGFENGEHVMAGAPAKASPLVNPTRYGLQLAGYDQRPMWDMLSVLFAARGSSFGGTKYFTVSKGGTVTVDGVTGDDVWGAGVDSGHYVLTNAATAETFSAMLDGFAHQGGFLAAK